MQIGAYPQQPNRPRKVRRRWAPLATRLMNEQPIVRRDFSKEGLVTYRSTRLSFSYVVVPTNALASLSTTQATLRIDSDAFFLPTYLIAESTYDTTQQTLSGTLFNIANQNAFNSFTWLATSRGQGSKQLSNVPISQQACKGNEGLRLTGWLWAPNDQIDFTFTNLLTTSHTPRITFHGYKIFGAPC